MIDVTTCGGTWPQRCSSPILWASRSQYYPIRLATCTPVPRTLLVRPTQRWRTARDQLCAEVRMRNIRTLVLPIELNEWFRFIRGPYFVVNLSDARAINVTGKYLHPGRGVPRSEKGRVRGRVPSAASLVPRPSFLSTPVPRLTSPAVIRQRMGMMEGGFPPHVMARRRISTRRTRAVPRGTTGASGAAAHGKPHKSAPADKSAAPPGAAPRSASSQPSRRRKSQTKAQPPQTSPTAERAARPVPTETRRGAKSARAIATAALAALSARWRRSRGMQAALILAAVTLSTAWLTFRTPAWYAPPRVDAGEHQRLRDGLQTTADEFTQLLLGREPFRLEFAQTTLNEWLAAREHIWPAARRLLPPDWHDPFVRFVPGHIEIAARFVGAPGEPIVSMSLAVSVEGDDVVLRATGCRVGSVPAPLCLVSPWLRRLSPPESEGESRVLRGNVVDGLHIPRRQVWWNGERLFQTRDVRTAAGVIALDIEPLGPKHQRR